MSEVTRLRRRIDELEIRRDEFTRQAHVERLMAQECHQAGDVQSATEWTRRAHTNLGRARVVQEGIVGLDADLRQAEESPVGDTGTNPVFTGGGPGSGGPSPSGRSGSSNGGQAVQPEGHSRCR